MLCTKSAITITKNDVKPVSYTHLDVYKRQDHAFAEIHRCKQEILAGSGTLQEKLEREFAKEIHILTADERLRSIARCV